ncbi:hypothetical protein [Chitinimonas taiwanensis]|uniref:hypothetical protein n=1 Tax=Chitinimonas taiwanensis TaxID=240412 RepID=UPI0035B4F0E7
MPNEDHDLSYDFEDYYRLPRFRTWLWLYCKAKYPREIFEDYFETPIMESALVNILVIHKENIKEIKIKWELTALPDSRFKWISEEKRQIDWILQTLASSKTIPRTPLPNKITGKTQITALFDFWSATLKIKSGTLNNLEKAWKLNIRNDSIFYWFEDEAKYEKLAFTEAWIQKNMPKLLENEVIIRNPTVLKICFDSARLSLNEKIFIIERIKKSWSTKKHREKHPEKKQFNILLDATVIHNLDILAMKNGVKRNKMLEVLIRREMENPGHLRNSFTEQSQQNLEGAGDSNQLQLPLP